MKFSKIKISFKILNLVCVLQSVCFFSYAPSSKKESVDQNNQQRSQCSLSQCSFTTMSVSDVVHKQEDTVLTQDNLTSQGVLSTDQIRNKKIEQWLNFPDFSTFKERFADVREEFREFLDLQRVFNQTCVPLIRIRMNKDLTLKLTSLIKKEIQNTKDIIDQIKYMLDNEGSSDSLQILSDRYKRFSSMDSDNKAKTNNLDNTAILSSVLLNRQKYLDDMLRKFDELFKMKQRLKVLKHDTISRRDNNDSVLTQFYSGAEFIEKNKDTNKSMHNKEYAEYMQSCEETEYCAAVDWSLEIKNLNKWIERYPTLKKNAEECAEHIKALENELTMIESTLSDMQTDVKKFSLRLSD